MTFSHLQSSAKIPQLTIKFLVQTTATNKMSSNIVKSNHSTNSKTVYLSRSLRFNSANYRK